ncbi:MAG: amidase [Rhodosalinus sp.]
MITQAEDRALPADDMADCVRRATEEALAACATADHVFTSLDPEVIALQARHASERARAGLRLSGIDGLRVAIKDNFDVQGQRTGIGFRLSGTELVSRTDACAVARLRRAGAILFGRTNMPPLAFSGLGLNAHLGTPRNPVDADRIPGGSTSGGAVAVARGLVDAALGSDTSGSVRIPAAFCGLVGFKPTHGIVPVDGVVPLAPSLDTVGTISRTALGCAALHRILTGRAVPTPPASLAGLRIFTIEDGAEDRDARVAAAFDAALRELRQAGALIDGGPLEAAQTLRPVAERGGFVAVEAHAAHGDLLTASRDVLDPFIAARLRAGGDWTADAYLQAVAIRAEATAQAQALFDRVDIAVLPTVCRVAPRLAEVATDAERLSVNRQVIRDTMLANLLGLCAISLPMTGDGLPVGLMLMARAHDDARLLSLAAGIEPLIRDL